MGLGGCAIAGRRAAGGAPARLAALFLLLAGLAGGCGGGAAGLTGGGVPPGRAALEGTVAGALDPGDPVAGAEVALSVNTIPPYTATTLTDDEGAFSFADVPAGDVTLQVTPPAGLPWRPHQARVHVRAGDTASLAVSVEPSGPALEVASLTVTPASIDAVVGVSVDLTARALLTSGHVIRPSLVVEGGVGRISRSGRFSPTRAGSGQIRVRAGGQERVVPVVVRAP